jgi:septal ring factor EnvC (AmiA/AmiB activator)
VKWTLVPPSNAAAIRAGRGAATPAACLGAALLFVVAAADLPDARAADGPIEITDQARRLKALEQEAGAERRRSAELAAERRRAEAEIARLGERSAAIAARIRAAEDDALALERDVARLSAAESETLGKLHDARASTARVLGAMHQLARRPPEALLVQSATPGDTVRTAVLLRNVVPTLESQANRLRESLSVLTTTRRQKAADLSRLAAVEAKLAAERVELAALTTEKHALFQSLSADEMKARERAQTLARDAQDLRELMVRLDAERRQREAAEREAREKAEREDAARKALETESSQKTEPSQVALRPPVGGMAQPPPQGAFLMPADGPVRGQYGESISAGQTRKGVEIEVRMGGQVVAPSAGRVVFAGPFRGYGQLLIIEHADGYHTLLAGLGRIDSSLGHTLVTGEPVGVMATDAATPPVLYLEIRRNGQPVNPLSWLAARKRNGKG